MSKKNFGALRAPIFTIKTTKSGGCAAWTLHISENRGGFAAPKRATYKWKPRACSKNRYATYKWKLHISENELYFYNVDEKIDYILWVVRVGATHKYSSSQKFVPQAIFEMKY